jgi:putative acetyltransferase
MIAEIRREREGDAPAIRAVNEKAFGQSVEADVIDTLRIRCPDSLSLVATVHERVVGHILFTPVTIRFQRVEIRGMGLAPMAVLPGYQLQGIGSRLVQRGIDALRERSCPFIIVLGHAGYYPRFGFVPASTHGLQCQWGGVPDDAFMVLVLDEAFMAGVSGIVRYRDEFNDAD